MQAVLSDAQVDAWRTHGYVVVEDIFAGDEVRRAVGEALSYLPTREAYDRADGKPDIDVYCPLCIRPAFGNGLAFDSLPFPGDMLNELAFHPRVVGAAEQLLGTDDLRLSVSFLRATYGGPETSDQALHSDHMQNTLLTPPKRATQLPMLIYLTDVGMGDAPTYVVSTRASEDRPLLPAHRAKDDDPELYANEQPVLARAGTVLFYSMRTWHRGSAGTDEKGLRLTHQVILRSGDHHWFATNLPLDFSSPAGTRCIERLTPRQRHLLGIPLPGDDYWDDDTIAGFAMRYPQADTEPYRAGARTR